MDLLKPDIPDCRSSIVILRIPLGNTAALDTYSGPGVNDRVNPRDNDENALSTVETRLSTLCHQHQSPPKLLLR